MDLFQQHPFKSRLFVCPFCVWLGWEPSRSCCFSSPSLPQSLVVICPGWSCCWNLPVSSFLLVTPSFPHQMHPHANIFPFGWKSLFWGPGSCFLGCSGRFCGDTQSVGALGRAHWAQHVADSTSAALQRIGSVGNSLDLERKSVPWGRQGVGLRPLCCSRSATWWQRGRAGMEWGDRLGTEQCQEGKRSVWGHRSLLPG